MKVGNWNQARCVAGQKQNPVLLQSIQQAIDALQKGGLMIVVDDDDRENEGDFIGAAESITPEPVDFMVRIGRGTLCVPVTSEDAARLKLRPVVDESSNNAPNKTAFLRAVDYISAGTGVSALNRTRTIRGLGEEISMTRNQIDHTWGTTC
jgi:3,4-dihydroxy 2-butanone 4-phosphate synthase/GTP cyclohydrolase II